MAGSHFFGNAANGFQLIWAINDAGIMARLAPMASDNGAGRKSVPDHRA